MSVALIEESAKEVRRLAIAGSPLAVGDFRLKKLIAPLEQAGAKVPVFAQVAKAVSEVVNGTEADSATRLLNLSTLLNAILYTQGQPGAVGEYRELEVHATNCSSTRTTARVLKPLVEALTSSGGGRFEIIKTALERGLFNDLRLIGPAIQALGDNYPEIADLVAEKILPAYGPGTIPQLKATLDLKGKKHEARKLTVIHQLDPAGTVELCKAALEDGSPDVKAVAIACLGKHEDCLPLVLEQANAKNKQLRAAALEALAEHDRPEVTKLFTDLVHGKALDILIGPFGQLRNRQVLKSLLEEGGRIFELMLKGDPEQISRLWDLLNCLQTRKEAEVEEYLLGCFALSDKLAKVKAAQNAALTGADLIARLTVLLYNVGSPKALEMILTKREVLPPPAFPWVLRSALHVWPAKTVFDEFSPLLEQKKGAGKEKANEIYRTMCETGPDNVTSSSGNGAFDPNGSEVRPPISAGWDVRWLDTAIKTDQPEIVCRLARPDHKGAVNYLLKRLTEEKGDNTNLIIQALGRCQYAKLADCFVNLVKAEVKGAQHLSWKLQQLFSAAGFLSAADLPKLDAFAATLDEKFVDRYLEAIAPLRPATQPTEAASI